MYFFVLIKHIDHTASNVTFNRPKESNDKSSLVGFYIQFKLLSSSGAGTNMDGPACSVKFC